MVIDREKLRAFGAATKDSDKPTILLVDDEQSILDAMSRLLRKDYGILTAPGGAEALELLRSEGSASRIALIVSDQRMPGMTGVQFLEQVIPLVPLTVRVILSGYTDIKDLVDAINKAHIHHFLIKPLSPEDLQAVVRNAVEAFERQWRAKKRLVELEMQVAEFQAELEKRRTG